jgi:hypothetical protein
LFFSALAASRRRLVDAGRQGRLQARTLEEIANPSEFLPQSAPSKHRGHRARTCLSVDSVFPLWSP